MIQPYSSASERISGSALDRADMHDRWLEFIKKHVFEYRLSSRKDRNFRIEAQSRTCDGWSVARFATQAGNSQLVRSSKLLSQELHARYAIFMSTHGTIELEQLRRRSVVTPSLLSMTSGAEPLVHTKLGDNDTLCLLMPRDFVVQRLVDAEQSCARTLDTQRGLGNLLLQSLSTLHQQADSMSDYEFVGAAKTVADLALLSIGGSADLNCGERSVRASNLSRIKNVIRKHLSNPDLQLSDVATQCGISLSYLHNLFRDDGRTAWEYLKAERLQRARQLLESSGAHPMTVTATALACGFTNMSQFSTAFKHAFSISPRHVVRGTSGRSENTPGSDD